MTKDVVSGMLERIDADLVNLYASSLPMFRGSQKMPPYRLNRQKKPSLMEYGLMVLRSKVSHGLKNQICSLSRIRRHIPFFHGDSNDSRVARFVCDMYTYGGKPFEGDPGIS